MADEERDDAPAAYHGVVELAEGPALTDQERQQASAAPWRGVLAGMPGAVVAGPALAEDEEPARGDVREAAAR